MVSDSGTFYNNPSFQIPSWASLHSPYLLKYCKQRYFAQLNFHASSPNGAHSCVLKLAHIPVNSICSIMIMIFTHIKCLHNYGPERNARKYVLLGNCIST